MHSWILSVHAGQSCGRIVAKLPFHDPPVVSLNSTGCVVFLMRFPFPSSLFLFFRPFQSLLPPLFLPSACLLSVGANNVAAEPLTLANDGGRFMGKVPLRTVLIRSLNWRILSLTWVRELCGVLQDLSQHWTHLLIAKRNFLAKNCPTCSDLGSFSCFYQSWWVVGWDLMCRHCICQKRLSRLLQIVGFGFQVHWNQKVHEPIASTMLWFLLKISFVLLLESGGK